MFAVGWLDYVDTASKPTFNKSANFFLEGVEEQATKVVEEYCWAITQWMGRAYCGLSGPTSVFDFGFKLDYLVNSNIHS
jgi:hypothetical protein